MKRLNAGKLRAAGYDARQRILRVEFDSGAQIEHTGVGEGLVTRWEVTETPDVPDWTAGHEHEPGVLGRTAPPRCLDDRTIDTGPLGIGALRPPYLHRASRAEAFQPAR